MRPQPILVAIALASNLQGCGLLVGDPPSMLLAEEAGFTFFDFIWHQGRPSIFWSVQTGALAGLGFLWFVFRHYRGEVHVERTAPLLGKLPSMCLFGVVAALAVDTQIEGGIGWGAVAGTGFFAAISIIWYAVIIRKVEASDSSIEEAALEHKLPGLRRFVLGLDWNTVLFLVFIFVPVAALEEYGWIGQLASGIEAVSGGSRLAVFIILVFVAMTASAFVDNVPFLLVMLPAVSQLADGLGVTGQPVFLYFGLLLGASVGGNITPVGAQANIAAVGFLRRQGEPVELWEYVSISLPYTIAAITAAGIFTYVVYG